MSHYLHHVPGRLRLKARSLKSSEEKAAATRALCTQLPGIKAIELNTLTGSLLVHYDKAAVTSTQILGFLFTNDVITSIPEARGHGQTPAATPPPRQAERLLYYVLPRERRENVIGCLEEDYYTTWLPKFGPDEARRMYWSDAIRSIAPMLWTGLRRSAIIAAALGVADWLRDRLG
jgi:Heavy metal associated domain 2